MNKTTLGFRMSLLFISSLMSSLMGCSSPEKPRNERTMSTQDRVAQAVQGPTVIYAHTEPSVVELNRDLQPLRPAEVIADVKDFSSPVTQVSLRFLKVPIEIPMHNIGGSTWRAELTPKQLQDLAVSGRTVRYDAIVVTKNEDGDVGRLKRPVQVAVKAPDLLRPSS